MVPASLFEAIANENVILTSKAENTHWFLEMKNASHAQKFVASMQRVHTNKEKYFKIWRTGWNNEKGMVATLA